MATYTDYLFFQTKKQKEIVNITHQVDEIVKKSGIAEGMVLVSAMHITANGRKNWPLLIQIIIITKLEKAMEMRILNQFCFTTKLLYRLPRESLILVHGSRFFMESLTDSAENG